MALATLLNIPQTEEEQKVWAFAHQDQHVKIVNALFQKNSSVVLPIYILDPMPTGTDMETWLSLNQAAHGDFSSVLGLENNDLSTVDWKQPDQVSSWIRLHFQSHYDAQNALGFSD